MANCESCIHKVVCKKYILIKSGCEVYMPCDVDKVNVTALMLRVQKLEAGVKSILERSESK